MNPAPARETEARLSDRQLHYLMALRTFTDEVAKEMQHLLVVRRRAPPPAAPGRRPLT